MCIQQLIKIFHIVEDLWLFPYFGLCLPWISENWHLADLVSINLCAKNYQSVPKVSRVMGIWP